MQNVVPLYFQLADGGELDGSFDLAIFLLDVLQLPLHVFECDLEGQGVVSDAFALLTTRHIFVLEGVFLYQLLQSHDFLLQVAVLGLQLDVLTGQQVVDVYMTLRLLLSMMLSCCLTSRSR